MDESMMRADLALRGWELIGGCWARAGMGGTLMFLAYNGVRVQVLQAALPDASHPHTVELLSHPRYPMDLDRLRTCHDIITKFERGLYEPATDGIAPNIARVDTYDARDARRRRGLQIY